MRSAVIRCGTAATITGSKHSVTVHCCCTAPRVIPLRRAPHWTPHNLDCHCACFQSVRSGPWGTLHNNAFRYRHQTPGVLYLDCAAAILAAVHCS